MPEVSVLITTYNRFRLLQRAIDSVLKQDFNDFELIVVDDHSSDGTRKFMEEISDPRVSYIRNEKNIGGKYGDREIFRQFAQKYAKGNFLIYLCDDDYWLPNDLLSRQMSVMHKYPKVSQVMGGQVQVFPNHLDDLPEIPDFWDYEWVPGVNNGLLMKGIFPGGMIKRDRFLELQAEDPVMRNVLTGASLFRRESFEKSGIFSRRSGSKWQAGYELTTGMGCVGDSYFFDEPCVVAGVDINSASFRGTQLEHMKDCLKSISIAFKKPKEISSYEDKRIFVFYEKKMKHAIIFNYIINKLSYKAGWFDDQILGGINNIFIPEISLIRFIFEKLINNIPFSKDNWQLLWASSLWKEPLSVFIDEQEKKYGRSKWHKVLRAFPMTLKTTG